MHSLPGPAQWFLLHSGGRACRPVIVLLNPKAKFQALLAQQEPVGLLAKFSHDVVTAYERLDSTFVSGFGIISGTRRSGFGHCCV